MPASALSEGRRTARLLALILATATIVWALQWWHCRFVAQQDPDSQDYAQIALNVYEGRGFQTSVMPLGGLEWRRQTERLDTPWWNLHRFPLPSAIMAGLFRLLGPSDLAVSLSSGLFFLATIPLVFLFGRRLFGDRVGLVAAFLYAFAGGPLEESITGLTEPTAIFLFLAAFYLVLWPRSAVSLALAGGLTGLAFLNRYSVVLYALPLLWLIWRHPAKRPWMNVLAFALPGLAVVTPWLYRTWLLAGDPFFSMTTALMVRYLTAASPHAHDWFQFVYEKPASFMAAHPLWIAAKWARSTGDLWFHDMLDVGKMPFVYPLFLLSVLMPLDGQARTVRRWLLGVFLAHFAILGLLSNIPRYYALFAPFMCVFGAYALLAVWSLLRARTSAARVAWCAFFATPLLLSWVYIAGIPKKPREDRTWVEWRRENQNWIRAHAPEGVIVSDVPWSVAWYGRRRSLPLPPSPADMSRFAYYREEPAGIYLKAPRRRQNVPNGWDDWRRVQFSQSHLPGFRLAKVFPDHAVFYVRTGRPESEHKVTPMGTPLTPVTTGAQRR